MARRRWVAIVFLLLIGIPRVVLGSDDPAELDVMTWNVESGGSDPAVIAQQMESYTGIDLWGIEEVQDADAAEQYRQAASVGDSSTFASILGTTGVEFGDRLLILYDTSRFAKIGSVIELDDINIGGGVRAPLAVELEDHDTGQDFLFMVNHLYQSKNAARHQQAQMLNQWAQRQTLPVIAVGDYNFNYDVSDSAHDEGFDDLTANNVFEWVKPTTLASTECSVNTRTHTCRYDSVLDFVFVEGAAQNWTSDSEIEVRNGDFPDNDSTSDHRPVIAHFEIGQTPPATESVTTNQ